MEYPSPTWSALLVVFGVPMIYGTLWLKLRRVLQLKLTSLECLSLTIPTFLAVGGAVHAAIWVLVSTVPFVAERTISLLELSELVLIVAPIVMVAVLRWRNQWRWEDDDISRLALQVLVGAVLCGIAVSSLGVWNGFRTDPWSNTQVSKELVRSDVAVTGLDPGPASALPASAGKYAGYHLVRAVITDLAREEPSRSGFAWSVLAVGGLVAAVAAIAMRMGLGLPGAGLAVVSMFLLGGDTYRFQVVNGPRGAAMIVLLGGLLLFAAVYRSHRWWLAAAAGVLFGMASSIHVQYIMVALAVFPVMLLLALLFKNRVDPRIRRNLVVAVVGSLTAFLFAFPQVRVVASPEGPPAISIEGSSVDGGASWAPQRIQLSDRPVIYAKPFFFMLDPVLFLQPSWGERSSALLGLGALGAALSLRKAISPILLLLLAASVFSVVVILLNPFVFPLWAFLFSITRSTYIGFEFAYLGVGLVAVLLRRVTIRNVVLTGIIAIGAYGPVMENRDWYARIATYEAQMNDPAIEVWKGVADDTAYSDILVAPRRIDLAGQLLPDRYITTPTNLQKPDMFGELDEPLAALSEYTREPQRVIFLLDKYVSPDAAILELIENQIVSPLDPSSLEDGAFYRPVDWNK